MGNISTSPPRLEQQLSRYEKCQGMEDGLVVAVLWRLYGPKVMHLNICVNVKFYYVSNEYHA